MVTPNISWGGRISRSIGGGGGSLGFSWSPSRASKSLTGEEHGLRTPSSRLGMTAVMILELCSLFSQLN